MHVCLGSDFWSYVQNHASLQEINKKKKIIKTKNPVSVSQLLHSM